MNTEFNQKRFDFLITVQTVLINNAINVSLNDDANEKRHIFAATSTMINMDDALYAADRIPENMTAYQAANSFLTFACENLREEGAVVPSWWARG